MSRNQIINGSVICTIISKNYLSQARILAESFLKHNKGHVFVLLADKVDSCFDPKKEKFTLIEIESLKDKIPNFNKFCFQYDIFELNTAVKPFFLEYLFEKYHLKKLIYLDPDILITDTLGDVFNLLDRFSIVLTPHILKPFRDTLIPNEIEILKFGIYNLGFLALSRSKTTDKMLKWWKKRLGIYCRKNPEEGVFVDQKWINFIPGFFDSVYILRDESYNVGYWNFHYAKVEKRINKYFVNGAPLHFMHFSGFNHDDPRYISKNQTRFNLNNLKNMKTLFETYRKLLKQNGYMESREWPYCFDFFNNNIKIPDVARKIYWGLSELHRTLFENPFDTGTKMNYFYWLKEPVDSETPVITRIMYEMYKMTDHAQKVFPLVLTNDRKAFVDWFCQYSKDQSDIATIFIRKA